MRLKLMYITNNTEVALIAEAAGVDRIFIDMEYIGKNERQFGLDTVKSKHTIQDVRNISNVIKKSDVLVRINPIYQKTKNEINDSINAGADILMLPMFKDTEEVEIFLDAIDGRAKNILLLETYEAIKNLDKILKIKGINEIHIGLNDLHLSMKLNFMFELLTNGVIEEICSKIRNTKMPFGIGGISRIGDGQLPAEYIIGEHYRLGSSAAILSRSFCNWEKIGDIKEIKSVFKKEVKRIKAYEDEIAIKDQIFFEKNHKVLCSIVDNIIDEKR